MRTQQRHIANQSFLEKMGGLQLDLRTYFAKDVIENIKLLNKQEQIPSYDWSWNFSQKLVVRIKDLELFYNPCLN